LSKGTASRLIVRHEIFGGNAEIASFVERDVKRIFVQENLDGPKRCAKQERSAAISSVFVA
jgi:hypothetical protein